MAMPQKAMVRSATKLSLAVATASACSKTSDIDSAKHHMMTAIIAIAMLNINEDNSPRSPRALKLQFTHCDSEVKHADRAIPTRKTSVIQTVNLAGASFWVDRMNNFMNTLYHMKTPAVDRGFLMIICCAFRLSLEQHLVELPRTARAPWYWLHDPVTSSGCLRCSQTCLPAAQRP